MILNETVIVEFDEKRLIATIKKDIERAQRATLEVESAGISAGQGLYKLKSKMPKGISWQVYLNECFGEGVISRSWANELIGLAHPELKRKTPAISMSDSPPGGEGDVDNAEEMPSGADDSDEGDSPQTVWRRGLLFRAQTAVGDAQFEDWSQFKVDQKVLKEVQQAADAWCATLKYIRRLYREQEA